MPDALKISPEACKSRNVLIHPPVRRLGELFFRNQVGMKINEGGAEDAVISLFQFRCIWVLKDL